MSGSSIRELRLDTECPGAGRRNNGPPASAPGSTSSIDPAVHAVHDARRALASIDDTYNLFIRHSNGAIRHPTYDLPRTRRRDGETGSAAAGSPTTGVARDSRLRIPPDRPAGFQEAARPESERRPSPGAEAAHTPRPPARRRVRPFPGGACAAVYAGHTAASTSALKLSFASCRTPFCLCQSSGDCHKSG